MAEVRFLQILIFDPIDAVIFLQMRIFVPIAAIGFLQMFIFQVMSEVGFLQLRVGRRSVMLASMIDEISALTGTVDPKPAFIPRPSAADPVKLLVAIADPIRWAVLRELAAGQPLSVHELAARVRQSDNLVSKHLRWLRAAAAVVVVQPAGTDRRISFHAVPAEWLRKAADGKTEIDYGVCVLRFP
jgi:DNA-binding transcriptional ArsR family regulator